MLAVKTLDWFDKWVQSLQGRYPNESFHIETSQLIFMAKELTAFYMMNDKRSSVYSVNFVNALYILRSRQLHVQS